MPAVQRVLVVEDDDAIRSLLAAALTRVGLEVDTANDGAFALQLTDTSDYAVIVLDLMMPRVSGFEFLEAFRRMRPHSNVVIIVLTAFDESMIGRLPADKVHAIVHKPFDVPQLAAVIREIVQTSTKLEEKSLPHDLAEGESLPAC
jgi:DNA-binding response OmpR family regulator